MTALWALLILSGIELRETLSQVLRNYCRWGSVSFGQVRWRRQAPWRDLCA